MKENKEKTIKKQKQKLSAFDIVYKVLTAVMAIATIPICYFISLVHVEISHPSFLNNLVGLLAGGCDDTQRISSTTYEKLSIKKFLEYVDMIKPLLSQEDGESFNIWSLEHFRPAIIASGFFAFALLIALVIFVVVIFIKNEKVIMALSATGFMSTVISAIIFSLKFAEPITSGQVTISDIFGINSIIANLVLSFIGNISSLALDIGFYSVMFLMLGIFCWSLCIYVVNIEDRQKSKQEKPKKIKK